MPGTRLRSLAPSGARPNGNSQRQAESCRHDGNVDVVQFTITLSIISQVLDFISKPKARFIGFLATISNRLPSLTMPCSSHCNLCST